MRRCIHMTGASGAGVSTIGAALARRRGAAWLDTDDFYWDKSAGDFVQKRPVETRLTLICAAIADASTGFVLSGSIGEWGDPLVPTFDAIIYVATDTALRLERLRRREIGRYGARALPGGDRYAATEAFIEWATGYDTGASSGRSQAKHHAWLNRTGKPVLQVNGANEVDANVALISDWLAQDHRGDHAPGAVCP
jgi:adenylate kinase family enzyme